MSTWLVYSSIRRSRYHLAFFRSSSGLPFSGNARGTSAPCPEGELETVAAALMASTLSMPAVVVRWMVHHVLLLGVQTVDVVVHRAVRCCRRRMYSSCLMVSIRLALLFRPSQTNARSSQDACWRRPS